MPAETSSKAKKPEASADIAPVKAADEANTATEKSAATGEIGGPEGPEPTRYGDWEKKGRCIDF